MDKWTNIKYFYQLWNSVANSVSNMIIICCVVEYKRYITPQEMRVNIYWNALCCLWEESSIKVCCRAGSILCVLPVSRFNEAWGKMAVIEVHQPPIVCALIVLEATEYMLGMLSSPISYLQRPCRSCYEGCVRVGKMPYQVGLMSACVLNRQSGWQSCFIFCTSLSLENERIIWLRIFFILIGSKVCRQYLRTVLYDALHICPIYVISMISVPLFSVQCLWIWEVYNILKQTETCLRVYYFKSCNNL
jgi:hypothetical protein